MTSAEVNPSKGWVDSLATTGNKIKEQLGRFLGTARQLINPPLTRLWITEDQITNYSDNQLKELARNWKPKGWSYLIKAKSFARIRTALKRQVKYQGRHNRTLAGEQFITEADIESFTDEEAKDLASKWQPKGWRKFVAKKKFGEVRKGLKRHVNTQSRHNRKLAGEQIIIAEDIAGYSDEEVEKLARKWEPKRWRTLVKAGKFPDLRKSLKAQVNFK